MNELVLEGIVGIGMLLGVLLGVLLGKKQRDAIRTESRLLLEVKTNLNDALRNRLVKAEQRAEEAEQRLHDAASARSEAAKRGAATRKANRGAL